MATLVVAGAQLKCSVGSSPGVLQIQGSSSVNAGLHAVATTADNRGFHFGMCPNQGTPSPIQCAPLIPAPWSPGSSSVMAGGLPVLTSTSRCVCQFGGQISVVNPGQSTTLVS